MASDETDKGSENGGKGSKMEIFKTCMRISFSHIGLFIIVLLYCVLGGFLFQLLEQENEILICSDSRKEYSDMENETLFSLVDIILTTAPDTESQTAQMVGVLETFRNNSLAIGYDGSWCEGFGHPDGPQYEWSLPGGLFFSVTVVSTIGYGHISPKTIWGRLLCISYAMVGIPLMLIFLANIGEVLADIFRYVYARIICCGCFKSRKSRFDNDEPQNRGVDLSDSTRNTLPIRTFTDAGTAALPPADTSLVQKTHSNSSFHDTSSSPGTEIKQRTVTPKPGGSGNSVGPNIQPINMAAFQQVRRRSIQHEPLIIDDSDDEDDEWEEIEKTPVPLTITMGIIGLYIFGGAVLFKYWEGWDLLQSSYFCFITLSTIGFGDVTPGRDFANPMANAQLILGSLYSIFGMAILSMCFALMQEEIVAKFNWLGEKLGLVTKEDDKLQGM